MKFLFADLCRSQRKLHNWSKNPLFSNKINLKHQYFLMVQVCAEFFFFEILILAKLSMKIIIAVEKCGEKKSYGSIKFNFFHF